MNIVIVGTAYPLRGGIAHFLALLADHLRRLHTVHTITFKRQYPKFLFPGKTQDETGEMTGAEPAPQLVDSINPFNWFSVGKKIARLQPDVLIFKYWLPFFGPCFGTIARIVKKKTGAKILFICDNIIPHERRPGDVWFTKYAFAAGDAFVVQSDAVERDLLQQFPGVRYENVPHPVYDFFGDPIPKEEARTQLGITSKNVILFFGYVRRYKGLHVLIDAVKELQQSGVTEKDTLLLSVGEFYDDESKYREQVRSRGLEHQVRFVSEYVPNNQVACYFSAADVVVLPYLSATQSGIAQIAYSFDRPVIATNVGGLAEVVVEGVTGFVVPSNDPHELANALRKFYHERKEAEFTQNVAKEKQKYSWENLVGAIERLVETEKSHRK